MLGDAFRIMTVTLWLYAASQGNGVVMAAATAVGVIPTFLFGTLAGVWVDRWDRRRTLILCDLLRLLCSLGLVAAAQSTTLWLGLVTLTLLSGVSVVADIAAETTIPRLVAQDDLERANGLWVVMHQLSFIVAPLAATWVYTTHGAAWAFSVDAVSFLLSALLLRFLPPLRSRPVGNHMHPAVLLDLWTGFQVIWRDTLIRASLLAVVLRVFGAGVNNTVMIFLIARVLHEPTTDLAWLGSANGLAQVLTGTLVVAAAQRASLPLTFSWGLGLMVVGAVVIASAGHLWVVIAGVILTSLGNAPANIAQVTLEQRFIAHDLLGRVKGVQNTLMTLMFLLGSAVAGATIHTLGAREWLWISAGFTVAAFALTMRSILPQVSRTARAVL